LQKQFYEEQGIPSPAYRFFENSRDILAAVSNGNLTLPFVQKLRKGGYDGRGVAVIKTAKDLEGLLEGASVVEEMVRVRKEISVIAARNKKGEVGCFPVVEMEFNEQANLVERLICPSAVSDEVRIRAEELAVQTISALNLVGVLAVELFVDENDRVWVNESAPRPHNSGHHSIESVITSQFEQHLRAIFNFSLGSTHLKLPAVMINLLGEPGYEGLVKYEGLTESMGIEGVKLHLYGKKNTKPFRKMGHVTILAGTIEEAKIKADIVKQKIKVKSW
jgi:5-(carboxyamino)imidazole ribonucleotide synthase